MGTVLSPLECNMCIGADFALTYDTGDASLARSFASGASLKTLEKALYNVIPPHRKHLIPKNIEALKLGYEYDLLPV